MASAADGSPVGERIAAAARAVWFMPGGVFLACDLSKVGGFNACPVEAHMVYY